MRTQHAVAQPVKRAYPHAARIDRQHRREARDHLFRSLIGEGNSKNAMRTHRTRADQISDARGQYARLAAARTGKNQRRLVRQRDGLLLGRIETGKE